MAVDPGLQSDTNIYMEAIASDGGVHNAGGTWWLSPDVMVGTTTPTGAVPQGANHVNVRVHNKLTGTYGGTPDAIHMAVWAAIPSAVINVSNPNQASLIGGFDVDPSVFMMPSSVFINSFAWTPLNDPSKPGGPGHKCLVARCFPDNLAPSLNNLFLPDDPHSVQHNLGIVDSTGVVPALRGSRFLTRAGKLRFEIATARPDGDEDAEVTLMARADFNPKPVLLARLQKKLEKVEGFERFALLPPGHVKKIMGMKSKAAALRALAKVVPQSFRMQLEDFPDARIYDFSRPEKLYDAGGRLFSHRFEAKFEMEPGQMTVFPFEADLSEVEPGNAQIFHITHLGPNRTIKGGYTLVVVKG